MINTGAFKIINRNFLAFKQTISISLIWLFAEPLLMFLILGYGIGALIDGVEGMSYFKFVAPGFMIATLMHVCINETGIGFFTKLQEQKKLSQLSLVPISKRQVILGEIYWGAIKGLISTLLMLFLSLYIGLIPGVKVFSILVIFVFTAFIFSSLGMMISSLSRDQNSFILFQSLVVYPMYFLSGVFFPLDQLPSFLFSISLIFPLTHAVMACKALTMGNIESIFFINLAVLFIYGFIFINVAFVNMKKKLNIIFNL
ncbi:MAG: ABC transporter permease [Bdellovibrionales bacterium]|nr:ABC transporter permease [Bdellovibrionales bacterium]